MVKDCAPGGSVVKVAAHGPSARHLSVMLQERAVLDEDEDFPRDRWCDDWTRFG